MKKVLWERSRGERRERLVESRNQPPSRSLYLLGGSSSAIPFFLIYSLITLLFLPSLLAHQTMAKPSNPPIDSHVAVLAFSFGTHAAPLLAVTRRLASAAPTTVFSFFNTAQSNASLFPSDETDRPANIRAHDVADGVPEGYALTGRPQEDMELFLVAAPENFRREIAAAEKEIGRKVNCMVTDAFFWFAADMAAETNVNWVAFWSAGPNSLSAHLYTDRIREAIGVKG